MTITLMNVSTGKEAISLCNQDLIELFGQSNDVDKDTLDMVNMMLYIKDWYNISDGAYHEHELAKVCREMPQQYRLRERITNLNKLWKICPTPNNTQGVQQSLKDAWKLELATYSKAVVIPTLLLCKKSLYVPNYPEMA